MQHSQQQQQRSFYRAKRPGNLNISCTEGEASTGQISNHFINPLTSLQQHQHIQPIQSTSQYMPNQNTSQQAYPQSPHPCSAYTNTNHSNYSYSPHIQPQTNSAVSPSYHPYQDQTGGNQYSKQVSYSNGYDPGQSYSPNYSPVASSAHIVNKQAHYFTFDVNNNNISNNDLTNGNITNVNNPTTPGIQYSSNINGTTNSQTVAATIYSSNSGLKSQISPNSVTISHSPHQNPSITINNQDVYAQSQPAKLNHTNYSQQQQQHHHQRQQSHYQFNHNYLNMPQSARPLTNHYNNNSSVANNINQGSNIQYHSVPSSPMNYQSSSNQNFQFNPNLVVNQLKQSIQQTLNGENFFTNRFSTNYENTSEALLERKDSFNFNSLQNTATNESSASKLTTSPQNNPVTVTDSEVKSDPLVHTNQYSENDVEMVQEILNDMIEKEEKTNILEISENPVINTTKNKPRTLTTPLPTQPLAMSCSSNSSINKELEIESPIISGIDEQQVSLEDKCKTLNKNNNNTWFSLSNLSAAASAEFEHLQYNVNDTGCLTSNGTNIQKPKKSNKPTMCVEDANSHKKFKSNDSFSSYSNDFDNITVNNTNHLVTTYNDNKINMSDDINLKFNVLDKKSSSISSTTLLKEGPSNENSSSLKSSSGHSNGLLPGGLIQENSITNCNECGKVFTNKSALAKHKLIHSNERKYACFMCDKSFKRQDHLNGHLLTHQEKKPFVCKAPGCNKSYCDSRSLKRHVESQHQDFLEQVARGNHQVLNFLPSIGKLKANVAPHINHEIIVKNPLSKQQQDLYSPITPIIDDLKLAQHKNGEYYEKEKPKNFFTFEEPKPETCKICGKGFKNIPALNGHMRLHGGFVIKTTSETKSSSNKSNRNESGEQQIGGLLNEDSMSSDTSSNSFSSNCMPGISSLYQQKLENGVQSVSSDESLKRFMKSKARSSKMAKPILLAQHNLMKQKQLEYEHQKLSNGFDCETNSKIDENRSNNSNGNSLAQLKTSHYVPEQSKDINKFNRIQANNSSNSSNIVNNNYIKSSLKTPVVTTTLQHSTETNTNNSVTRYHKNSFSNNNHQQQNSYDHYAHQSPSILDEPYLASNKPLSDILTVQANPVNIPWLSFYDECTGGSNNTSILTQNSSFDKYSNLSFDQSNSDSHVDNKCESIANKMDEFKSKPNLNTKSLDKSFSSDTNSNYFSSFVENSITHNKTRLAKDHPFSKSIDYPSSISKQSKPPKFKPEPLVIPSTISSFQQPSFTSINNTNNPYLMHSQSMSEFYNSQKLLSSVYAHMANIYPNTTFLKSPRLVVNYDLKKQYTPPPMLSPFRKGPGLFCNSKQFSSFFQMPTPYERNPLLNNSVSYMTNLYNQHLNNTYMDALIAGNIQQQKQQQQNIAMNYFNNQYKTSESSNLTLSEEISQSPNESPMKLVINTSRTVKEISMVDTFFPASSETSSVSQLSSDNLVDINGDLLSTNAFINEGDEYQAVIPEFKELSSEDLSEIVVKEDLMWSDKILNETSPTEFDSYMKLITKNSLVFGESNNLELGLHVLHYYDGDFERAVKSFLSETISLPEESPILNYSYGETEVWSKEEVKLFEESILKHDKNFAEVSAEIGTKSTKRCIEFYYFWKKVMSDYMKKKWRIMKKNRLIGESSVPNNMRSSGDKSEFKDTTNNLKRDQSKNSKRNKIKCPECDLMFKTKHKLKFHLNSKHNHAKKKLHV